MPRMITLIITLATFFGLQLFAHAATEIKKRSGQIIQGEVLYEEPDGFYMETPSGVINVKKSDIAELNGKLYGAPHQESQPQALPDASNSKQTSLNQPSRIIKVGNSVLSSTELDIYLRHLLDPARHQHLSGMDWNTNDIQIRKAIEDEIVFQEALKANIHKKEPTHTNIIELFKAKQTISSINPNEFSESDMRSFYEANRKEFTEPSKYIFQLLSISDASKEIAVKARTNPESLTGWKKGGWIEEGDTFYLPLTKSQEQTIFKLKKNQVSEIITDGMGQSYLFWCIDYKPQVQKTFEQARDRIKHLMIKEQQSGNEKVLMAKVRKVNGATSTDELFAEAIKAETHRDRHIRDQIINYYLAETGMTLGAIVLEVKNKYAVEIQ